MPRRFLILIIIPLVFFGVYACRHKPQPQPVAAADGNFPPGVAEIIINKCAVKGCHNQKSYQNCDSLLLDTWDHLFQGATDGAVAVPYSTLFSSLLYYINVDSSLGLVQKPTMPPEPSDTPLSKAEYMTIYNWIANGCPDKNGNIPFASNPDTRQKIYLTQQGCDLLAVIDAQSKLVMRYIPIGADPNNIESPHSVRISDDGSYAYVSFLAGRYIQKIDTRFDSIISSVYMGGLDLNGSWNITYLSPIQDTAFITSDWVANGLVGYINTTSMQIEANKTLLGSGLFVYPHGITSNAAFDTFYITAQYGNIIYKITMQNPKSPFYKQVSLNGKPPQASGTDSTNTSSPNPHEIIMAPDYSKYFVTCQSTNEVRVMDPYKDTLIKAIPVGVFPQEMAISYSRNLLFVTCMQDHSTVPGAIGSVYVIDMNTLQIVTVIYGNFNQPHGVAVDDKDGLVFIASTNAVDVNGVAPHHVTACAGNPGWYNVYNLNTLQPADDRSYNVTVMPYSAAVRFK